MSLSIAIVGLPNVGKSTLFNALLRKQVALAANYPFATIEPNVGIAEVPDARLLPLAQVEAGLPAEKNEMGNFITILESLSLETQKKLPPLKPAVVEFVDVAGLVRGASEGEGLGNKFLAHIRETQAICHVLRAFSDDSVLREGAVSPQEDLTTIRTELQLADLATLEKQRPPKGNVDKKDKENWVFVEKFTQRVGEGKNAIDWSENAQKQAKTSGDELQVAKELNLLTAKKEIMVINVDEREVGQQAELTQHWAEKLAISPDQIVIISAKIESELSVLTQEDQQLYLDDLGLKQSGLERLAKVAYKTLGLQSFLTAGEIEVKAWTVVSGATASQAAGVIHTDFEKNFIKAKVVSFADFIEYGGWAGAKEKGKLRLEGKEYVMQDGDVVEFMV